MKNILLLALLICLLPATGAKANPLLYKDFMKNASVADIQEAIDKGADINARIEYDITVLMLAARYNENPEVTKLLIEHGADVNARDEDASTAPRLMQRIGKAGRR